MTKPFLTLILSLFLYTASNAQKGSITYYLKDAGQLVFSKDSADYWMVVSPPDTSISKFLYVVQEYGKNGRLRLQTTSKTNDLNLFYHGKYIAYYPDGRKMRTGEYANGKYSGTETGYYRNGNIYNIKDYKDDGSVRFVECRDSTGKVLAENGNGTWLEYNSSFKDTTAKGPVVNGLMNGAWTGRIADKMGYENIYVNGVLKDHKDIPDYEFNSSPQTNAQAGSVPTFPGGIEKFYQFLAKTVRYPREARQAGEHGKVTISFMVETDGSLSDIKITKSVSESLDGESIRVMKLSPKWVPAIKDGKPIRMEYSIPIGYWLSE